MSEHPISPEQEASLRATLQAQGYMVTGEEPLFVTDYPNAVKEAEILYTTDAEDDEFWEERVPLSAEEYEQHSSITDAISTLNRNGLLPAIITTPTGSDTFVVEPYDGKIHLTQEEEIEVERFARALGLK